MPVANPENIEARRRLEKSILEFYTPSDIRYDQELLVKTRYIAKIQLPALVKTLLAGSAFLGSQIGLSSAQSAGGALLGAGIGAASGGLIALLLKATGALQDEIVLTLVESVSGIGIDGGSPHTIRDGATGMVYKYHTNSKNFGSLTMKFYRERNHEEFQRTITLLHLFINFGMKCNMIIEKYSLDKSLVSTLFFEGVGFHSLSYDELTKTTGGAWMYTLTGTVDYWTENLA